MLFNKNNYRLQEIKDFIRHTGILLSSRKAEDTLFLRGVISRKQIEAAYAKPGATGAIKANLCHAYGAGSISNVFLCNSGMNAVYAAFEAIIRLNGNTEKQTIIQAGWLYLDTLEIIKKFSNAHVLINSVTDIAQLEEKIVNDHRTIGAVFNEIPNNPLLECVDLPRLYELCSKYDIPLIVDSTIGTAYNLTVLPYCDIAVESLTKFACGKGCIPNYSGFQ